MTISIQLYFYFIVCLLRDYSGITTPTTKTIRKLKTFYYLYKEIHKDDIQKFQYQLDYFVLKLFLTTEVGIKM